MPNPNKLFPDDDWIESQSADEYPPMPGLPFKQSSQQLPTSEYEFFAFQFAPDTYQTLLELAEAEGGSLGDTLRDVIALSKWFKDVRESGANVLIERNGKFRKVVKIR